MSAIEGLTLAVAAALAALMGRSIQRGATCLVAAVDELVAQHRARRLLAMLEAGAWVGAGLVILRAVGALPRLPSGAVPGLATVAGAVLLGLGAWVNRACVFGAIARFASGDLAYLATPLGFWLGCVAFQHGPLATMAPPTMTPDAPLLASVGMASAVAGLVAAMLVARVAWGARRALLADGSTARSTPRARAAALLRIATDSPHAATVLIGIAFLALLRLAGPWAYTDVLADWSRGRMADTAVGGTLLVALFAGAAWGGRGVAGRWRTPPSVSALIRCTSGGAMMGWGSQWIPGGNDGLLLMGLPLGYPYAGLAIVVMGMTIAGAMTLSRRRSRASPTLRGSAAPSGRPPS